MKYKLISKQTGEEYLCDKVTIDGFDYYIEDGSVVKPIDFSKFQYQKPNNLFKGEDGLKQHGEVYEVIATNNPDIDIPKIMDKNSTATVLAKQHSKELSNDDNAIIFGFIEGYNKSQETHPFTEEDMVEFAVWLKEDDVRFEKWATNKISSSNLLQLWKEQQRKILYYE